MEFTEQIPSNRGKRKIMHNGYVYVKQKDLASGVTGYECEKRRGNINGISACKAKIKVNKDGVVIGFLHEHTHPPDTVRCEVLQVRQNIARRAIETDETPQQILDRELRNLSERAALQMIPLQHLRRQIRRKRQTSYTRQASPAGRSTFESPDQAAYPQQSLTAGRSSFGLQEQDAYVQNSFFAGRSNFEPQLQATYTQRGFPADRATFDLPEQSTYGHQAFLADRCHFEPQEQATYAQQTFHGGKSTFIQQDQATYTQQAFPASRSNFELQEQASYAQQTFLADRSKFEPPDQAIYAQQTFPTARSKFEPEGQATIAQQDLPADRSNFELPEDCVDHKPYCGKNFYYLIMALSIILASGTIDHQPINRFMYSTVNNEICFCFLLYKRLSR